MASNKYKYKALDQDKKTVTGIVEATNEEIAIDVLTDKGMSVIGIQKENSFDLRRILTAFNRVTVKDLVIFARQLSVLVSANLPLIKALQVLKDQTSNLYFQKVISKIIDDIDGGVRLSKAFAKYPGIFNDFYISMVESGETSGKLEDVLTYLADQQEKDYDLKSKIKGAMIYPIFILSGLGIVGAVMMVFVVPKLTAILLESGGELPFATRMLIWLSNTMKNYWWLLIIIGIFAFISYKVYIKTSIGKRQWDFIKLKMPIFGNLFQKICIVRFTRGFSTLIVGGVTISKGLEIVSNIVGNEIYKDIILETIKEVEGGKSMATVFMKSKIVPKMVAQLMVMGEETGKLDEIFSKISDFYAREVDNLVRNLVTLIEPLIMVMMGLAVGLLVSAIILPMYQMATKF